MIDLTQLVATAAMAIIGLVLARRGIAAVRHAVAGHRAEDVLTVVAAVIATTVQADGMWVFFTDIVPVPVYLRVLMFAFLEVAVFVSGLRARRNIKETGSAGIDGAAVWAIAAISGLLASTAAGSFRGALLRLTAAAVAAWLWERGLAGERRRARAAGGRDRRIHWRITPERVLVFLGLAEPTDRTAGEVDAHRRLYRLARRAMHVRGGPWLKAWAKRRLNRTAAAAVAHAGLATDPARQAELMAMLAVLYNAPALAELEPEAPWFVPVEVPRLRLVRAGEVGGEVGGGVPEDVPDDGGEQAERSVSDGSGEEPDPPDGERSENVPEDVPAIDPEELEKLLRRARRAFRRELAAGRTPSIRRLMSALRIGQDKARAVQAALVASGSERGA